MKNLRRLACKFDLNQSERKSSQVNASACKSWPNGVASRPKFSTCDSVWPGLLTLPKFYLGVVMYLSASVSTLRFTVENPSFYVSVSNNFD